MNPAPALWRDPNYARAPVLRRFRAQSGGAADFIVRLGWNALQLTNPAGNSFDLVDYLQCLPLDPNPHEVNLRASVGRDEPALAVRLILQRKTPEAAEATRVALRRSAVRKGKTLDPRSLIAADFMIPATSLPKNGYSAKAVLAAYRLRWQIELAFKRLKSLLHIDRLPTWTERGSRSWLYAHLILALLCDDLSQDFLDSSPEDLLDAAYVPSLWAVQKTVLMVLIGIVIGPLAIADILAPGANLHRHLANAPRTRKPHIRYPVRDLF